MIRILGSWARVRMLLESLISLDRIVRSRRIGLLAADSGHQDIGRGRVRPRRKLCLTYANRDPSRLTATKPPARTPVAHTRRDSLELCACPEPIPYCTPRWPHPSSRQPKSLTRSLAACRTRPDVQLIPKALFHIVFSRSGCLDRLSASCCLSFRHRAATRDRHFRGRRRSKVPLASPAKPGDPEH